MPRRGAHLSDDARVKQSAAIAEWKKKNIENLSVGLRAGKRDAYKRLAASRGMSVSAMIQAYMDTEYRKEFGKDPK